MSRRDYLAAVIRLYLAQPGAPLRASRNDWAAAQDLYARSVDLADLGHAVRLATLRRLTAAKPCPPVRCLDYYRHVLDQLDPDELDPGYVHYIARRYALLISADAPSNRQNRAVSDRR